MKVIFEPVAQSTIIRPMAEAVCIVRGGQPVPYIDTMDHKQKIITLHDLHFLTLQAIVNRRKVTIDGYQMAMKAKHQPISVQVNANDVQVFISPTTTVEQAMIQFYKKLKLQQKKDQKDTPRTRRQPTR